MSALRALEQDALNHKMKGLIAGSLSLRLVLGKSGGGGAACVACSGALA